MCLTMQRANGISSLQRGIKTQIKDALPQTLMATQSECYAGVLVTFLLPL